MASFVYAHANDCIAQRRQTLGGEATSVSEEILLTLANSKPNFIPTWQWLLSRDYQITLGSVALGIGSTELSLCSLDASLTGLLPPQSLHAGCIPGQESL